MPNRPLGQPTIAAIQQAAAKAELQLNAEMGVEKLIPIANRVARLAIQFAASSGKSPVDVAPALLMAYRMKTLLPGTFGHSALDEKLELECEELEVNRSYLMVFVGNNPLPN